MRNKYRIFTLMIIILVLLSGCNMSEGNLEQRITAPKNLKPPISGKWKVVELLNKDIENKSFDENINIEGLFRKDAVILGRDYTVSPSYRIKNVDAGEYFLYKYKIDYKDLNLEDKKIQVVTVLNDENFFFDIIKVSDEDLVLYKDENFYRMEKTADEVSKEEVARYIEIEKSILMTANNIVGEDIETGLLLGVKTPKYDNKSESITWDYQTIWLNIKNQEVISAVKLKDILLPRKNGFWNVSINRTLEDKYVKDDVVAKGQINRDLDKDLEESTRNAPLSNKRNSMETYELKNILFLSNDYISLEKIDGRENSRRTLEIHGIDSLKDNRPIKLSDIVGDNGHVIFHEGAESIMELNETARVNERNIGLSRKDGYWIFKGRVNYVEKDKELYKDFDIKAIPPEEIVKYDKLSIAWKDIDAKVIGLVDAFSSPNEEVLIVQTEDSILVFKINDGKIVDDEPVYKIELEKNSSIIMSEWATDRYTSIWEKEVMKNEYEEMK